MTVESTGWFHPAVPINGMVESEAPDGSFTAELLDDGTSGVRSVLWVAGSSRSARGQRA